MDAAYRAQAREDMLGIQSGLISVRGTAQREVCAHLLRRWAFLRQDIDFDEIGNVSCSFTDATACIGVGSGGEV